jgi:deoxyribose-phosphate aldolase
MRAVAAKRPGMKVKASGGIGTLTDVRRMVEAGADRIGASRTAQIVADAAAGTTQAAVPSSTGQY